MTSLLPAPPPLHATDLLQAAVEQAFNAVVITNAVCRMGWPAHHLLQPGVLPHHGLHAPQELLGPLAAPAARPTTDPQVLQRLRECLQQGTFFQGSTVNYRKDGSSYLVEWNVPPCAMPRVRCRPMCRCSKTSQRGWGRAAPGPAGTGTACHPRRRC